MASLRSIPAHRRYKISSKLSRQHLEAIGRVATEWSALEMEMIHAISSISGVGYVNACILAGPSAFASWVDMLIVLTRQNKEQSHNEIVFEALCKLMKKLLTLRNYMIHAHWMNQVRNASTTHYVMVPIVLRAADKAVGVGIPKRGRDITIEVRWTAPQMRTVIRSILGARLLLQRICFRPPPTSPQARFAPAGSDRTILRQIRTMLDTLPDPFQKSKAKQSSRPKA